MDAAKSRNSQIALIAGGLVPIIVLVPAAASCILGWSGLIVSAPVALLLLLFFRRGRLPVIGAVLGWALWVYDHDFFLNPGGPARPLSGGIEYALRYTDWELPASLAAFLLTGCGVGFWCLGVRYLIKHGSRPPYK